MKKASFLLTLLITFSANAKLLDKIAGVINDKVYSLSELKRIKKTISARKEIAPFIYKKKSISLLDVLKIQQRKFIIKDKLSAQGFVVSDDSVEARIKDTEKKLGLRRGDLIQFLKAKGISFDEYFELIREATEYNIFNRRIITPLVNITEQELKSLYYKKNSSNKALSFQYDIVDFTISRKKVQKSDLKKLPSILRKYQKTGNLPSIYNSIETNNMGELSDDDLPKDLSRLLQKTNEKTFSKAYVKNGVVHLFYLKKKELTASQEYLQAKGKLYNELYAKRSKSITSNWFSRESLQYYILEDI